MIKLIVFDWDDVFTLGSRVGYFKCYHDTMIDVGINLGKDEEKKRILAKWGTSHYEEFQELLKDNPELIEKACSIYEKKLFGETFVDCLYVLDDVVSLLNRLHKNQSLAIATGMHPKLLKEVIIPKFGFPDVFLRIMSSYDVKPGQSKPSPFMVEDIMKSLEINPSETVVVGDSKSDVLMAQAAGVIPIVVLSGNLSEEQAKELNVKYIVKDVTEIESALDEINN